MNCNEHDSTSSSSSSSSGASTPVTPASDLPSSPWPTLHNEVTKELLQSVLKARKTWKTSRGGEEVWPVELEAALLEALEKYEPDDSRETRMLGRFPLRNRFISDYIFEKTGKRRSPKQVGSRLQQLRESCGGKQLLDLLSPFRKPAYSASSPTDSRLDSPKSSFADGLFTNASSTRHTVIHIDILPPGSTEPIQNNRSSLPCSDNADVVHVSDSPRPLESINPIVSFTSPSPILAHSRFTVYSEDIILHTETVPLVAHVAQEAQTSGILYTTRLVPRYWQTILDSPDPTRFVICHEVLKGDDSPILFSATYKFNYPRYSANSSWHHAFTPYNPPDMPSSAVYPAFSGTDYAMPSSAPWDPTLLPQGNSPILRYPSPDSDSSSVSFPGNLSGRTS